MRFGEGASFAGVKYLTFRQPSLHCICDAKYDICGYWQWTWKHNDWVLISICHKIVILIIDILMLCPCHRTIAPKFLKLKVGKGFRNLGAIDLWPLSLFYFNKTCINFVQGVENAKSVCRKIACYTPASKSIKTSTGAFPYTTCGDKKVNGTWHVICTLVHIPVPKILRKSHTRTNNKVCDSRAFSWLADFEVFWRRKIRWSSFQIWIWGQHDFGIINLYIWWLTFDDSILKSEDLK